MLEECSQGKGNTGCRSTVEIEHVIIVNFMAVHRSTCSGVAVLTIGFQGGGLWEVELTTVTRHIGDRSDDVDIVASFFQFVVEGTDVGGCPAVIVGHQDVLG